MGNRILKGLIIGLGVLVFLIMMLYFAWDGSKVLTWGDSGFVLCAVVPLDEGNTSFAFVDRADFAGPPYPAFGDTLLTIEDSTASLQRWIDMLETPHVPGKEVSVTFLHDGNEYTTTMVTRPVQRAHFFTLSLLQILKLIISLSFIALAFLAFFRRSDSTAVRVLMLYCFAMAAAVIQTYMPMFPVMAKFQIPYLVVFQFFLGTFTFFFSAFWLNLNMVFPRPIKLMKRKPVLGYAICFAPQVILIISGLFTGMVQPFGIRIAAYSVVAIQVIAGLLILGYNYRHAESTLEKRQTKLVLWGSGIPLLAFLVYGIDMMNLHVVMPPLTFRLLVYDITFFIILASPLSFAYAMRRYRLMEVEARLKRGTRFVLITVALLAVFVLLVYGFSGLLLRSFSVESRATTVLVTLLLALGFIPAHRYFRAQIERHLYPERTKLRRMLDQFLANIAAMPDRGTLWSQLEENLKQGLGIESVIPVLRNGDGRSFCATNGKSVPLDPEGAIIHELETTSCSLICNECLETDKLKLTEAERQWIEDNRAAMLLPMVVRSRLIGFLGITFEQDRDDMEAEDLSILTSVASQVALQSENLRLIEENFDKRRMEEQLANARQVQERFLPSKLPKTPGLQVAARFLSSHEVAGDYYDVIPLPDRRTLIAVGDVSGKGAGAAMIMANVQASLRSMAKVKIALAELVSGINDLICNNTSAEQYVTFFAAIFDPNDNSLTYVNAGHNAPRIIKENGKVKELWAGGTVLGVLDDVKFEEETVCLESGELLVAFTDGVCEAMNERDEEFGEDRIIDIVQRTHLEPPGTILQVVEKEVATFRGGRLLEDDFTLLVIKADGVDEETTEEIIISEETKE